MFATKKYTVFYLFTFLNVCFATAVFAQTTYYLDALSGNDSNIGNRPEIAWKTLNKLNETNLFPGDSVLFRKGGKWRGNLLPRGSGKSGHPIVFDAYGNGPLPVIDAAGRIAPGEKNSYTIRLRNQEYIEFRNLRIENYHSFETPIPVKSSGKQAFSYSKKTGIYVEAHDTGTLHHIWFTGLEICSINGSMNTKNNGGIFMEVTGNEDENKRIPTNFEDVLLSGCYIHDVDRTGFSNTSIWSNRSLTSKWKDNLENGKVHNWFPSKKIIIRNNKFERTGANALIVRVAESPLVEYNLFNHCAIKGSGNASFPFNCDNALFQYNEASYTVYNSEADSWDGKKDADAGGFDSDYKCKNTVIQYNYSHHNGYGGILICCMGNNKTAFNDGTIIRYNIFENNQHHIIRTSGPITNTKIYNNVIFSGSELDSVMLLYHKSWSGFSDSTAYLNNIFYSKGNGNYIDLGKSTRNIFKANTFFGKIGNEPDDSLKSKANPRFISTTSSESNWKNFLRFMLQSDSPEIDQGIMIEGHSERDFIGNQIQGPPDRGVFEMNKPKIF